MGVLGFLWNGVLVPAFGLFGIAFGVAALVMAVRGTPSMARSRWEGAAYLLFWVWIVAWPAHRTALSTIDRLARLSLGGGMAIWLVIDVVRRWRQLPVTVQKPGAEKPLSETDANRSE